MAYSHRIPVPEARRIPIVYKCRGIILYSLDILNIQPFAHVNIHGFFILRALFTMDYGLFEASMHPVMERPFSMPVQRCLLYPP